MAVRLTSPTQVMEGHTVDISAVGTFVACVPLFRIGEELLMEILLAADRVADLSLRAIVTRRVERRTDDDPAVGLGLTWVSAICRSSPLPMQHFLEHILHITAPHIEAAGSELYWYSFKQSAPEAPQPDSRTMRPTSSLSRLREAFGRPVRVPVHADSAAPAGQDSAPPVPRRRVERKVRVATSQHAVRRESDATRTQPMAWGTGGPVTVNRPDSAGSRPPSAASGRSPAAQAGDDAASQGAARPPARPLDAPPGRAAPDVQAPPPAGTSPARPIEERRRRRRVEVSTPVTYFIGSESHVGRSVDVSRAGVYVKTDGPLPKLGDRTNIRLPVLHAGRHHVVMLTTRIVRYKGPAEKLDSRLRGFAADYQVVDELGVPGIFSHFLRTRMEDD